MGSLWYILLWGLHSAWQDCNRILQVLRHGTVRSVAFCIAELEPNQAGILQDGMSVLGWEVLQGCLYQEGIYYMKRVGLVVAYDGTKYSGWQTQPNGITIQGVLNDTLSELLGEKIETIGASRTDAGVHALGNVAVFDTESRIPGEKFSYALNQRLPEDIRIQLSEEVEPDFHPRYCDSEKTYEYRILNRKFPVPTERLYSYFYHYKLDVDKMKEATSYLIGRHDFASFCGSGAQVKTTIRTVTSMDVWRDGDMVTIRISGTGFLYNMVRIISGTLIEIGNGQYPPERMDKILKACDRGAAGPTAPAQGLTLMGIEFF